MRKKIMAFTLLLTSVLLAACSSPKTADTTEQTEKTQQTDTTQKDKQTPQSEYTDTEIEAAKTAVKEYLKTREGEVKELGYDKEVEKNQKGPFIEFGMGTGLTEDNVLILTGKGTYKKNGIEKEAHTFYLGRKDKDSQWEVKDMSY